MILPELWPGETGWSCARKVQAFHLPQACMLSKKHPTPGQHLPQSVPSPGPVNSPPRQQVFEYRIPLPLPWRRWEGPSGQDGHGLTGVTRRCAGGNAKVRSAGQCLPPGRRLAAALHSPWPGLFVAAVTLALMRPLPRKCGAGGVRCRSTGPEHRLQPHPLCTLKAGNAWARSGARAHRALSKQLFCLFYSSLALTGASYLSQVRGSPPQDLAPGEAHAQRSAA